MEKIERNGVTFHVIVNVDDDSDAPWNREDGHGPVSEWTRRAKAPGERVLCSDHGLHRFYDFAAAVRAARADGWGSAGDDGLTPGAKAARAAEADYERLRQWCDGQWEYVGVIVRPECPECGEVNPRDYRFAIWGIESDCADYISEVANDLVNEALRDMEESAVDCRQV